jgi:predicted RecB family nuclease
MLIKPPPPSFATTFSFSNDRAVRLVKGVRCPHCRRELTATDDILLIGLAAW